MWFPVKNLSLIVCIFELLRPNICKIIQKFHYGMLEDEIGLFLVYILYQVKIIKYLYKCERIYIRGMKDFEFILSLYHLKIKEIFLKTKPMLGTLI